MTQDAIGRLRLADCPPGVFRFDGSLGFKTEYGMTQVDENGADMPGDQVRWVVTNWPDAYCLDSGEVFWGGAKSHAERAELLVEPIDDLRTLLTALDGPTPAELARILYEADPTIASQVELLPMAEAAIKALGGVG